MALKMKHLLLLGTMFASQVMAAPNAPSGSPRTQGVPAGYGDPVQVTIRNTDGSDPVAIPVSMSATPTGAATAANQTTQITNMGAPGDTACATDNGSCSLNAQNSRTNQRLTTINTTLGTPFQAGGSIANTSFASTQSGTWNITNVSGTVSLPTGASTAAKQPALGTAGTASSDVITVQGIASMTPVVTTPYSTSPWNYAAASGGITNTTTAVTIKSAAGASTRNYITSIQYDFQSLTNATELAIRDGAAGTVLWRGYIPSGVAGIREITFPVPLRGTANTLLEVVTLTASGAGAVYVNAQGYTGS